MPRLNSNLIIIDILPQNYLTRAVTQSVSLVNGTAHLCHAVHALGPEQRDSTLVHYMSLYLIHQGLRRIRLLSFCDTDSIHILYEWQGFLTTLSALGLLEQSSDM